MKTVIKNKLFLGISAGLALVLLSGCGGGGGGSGSGAGLTTPEGQVSTNGQTSLNTLGSTTSTSQKVVTGSQNTPLFGSISQSSNGDGGVTRDHVEVELSYVDVADRVVFETVETTMEVAVSGDYGQGTPGGGGTYVLVPIDVIPGASGSGSIRLNDDGSCQLGSGIRVGSGNLIINGQNICEDAADYIGDYSWAPGRGFSGGSGTTMVISQKQVPMTVTRPELDFSVVYEDPGDGTNPGTTVTLTGEDVVRNTELSECLDAGGTCRQIEFEGSDGEGTYWVDFYVHLGEGVTTQASLTADPNWLAGGVWIYVPDDAAQLDDLQIGAYGDGGDPFTAANVVQLTGVATYSGGATGIYLDYENGESNVGYFDADVALTANFGTGSGAPGSVSGRVYGFESEYYDGDGDIASFEIMLGNAPIGAGSGTADDNTFEGETSAEVTEDGTTYEWSGQWGGQFFGNPEGSAGANTYPEMVGGTFGAACTGDAGDADGDGCASDGDDPYWSGILGVFGAGQE